MTMVCRQVDSNQATISFASSQGHFKLNAFKPVIANAMLQSIRLLSEANRSFADRYVVGIEANEQNIDPLIQKSLMLVTALAPKIGYDRATEIAKTAHENCTTLKEKTLNLGYMTAEDFDAWVDPKLMIGPSE